MAQYREQVVQSKLFKQFDLLVGVDDVSNADVAALKELVLAVSDEIGPRLDRIRATFWQYTEHDLRHLCNVADLIYRFLPKSTSKPGTDPASLPAIRLNAVELAFMWLGILLHDMGMYVSDKEKQEIIKSKDYEEYLTHHVDRVSAAKKARGDGQDVKARAIEDAIFAEFIRRIHPERARAYIIGKLAKEVRLEFRDVSFVNDLGDLCESHGWGVRESNDPRNADTTVSQMQRNRRIGAARVNLQYLACCLRLGDILDFDKSRTPASVYEEIDFTEDASVQEWNKHLSIDGWDIDEHRVLFDASCTHPAYYVAVHEFLNWVDDELRECRYLLDENPAGDADRYSLQLAHVVDRRQVRMSDRKYVAGAFRFRLEYEEIMRLLMDKSLYPDPTLFLRELLQNALDACRYQSALAKEAGMDDKYIPRIMAWDYSKDEKNPRIVFQDNGIGMSQRQVENFFLRVGKSFYRSAEFDAERHRLEKQGISLDACSQFGIGFLSCFLAGDHIEVETWRYGSDPLKITITGPSKYFLIERLKPPTRVIQFKSPANELDDGPWKCPGTRVTVYLKDGWHSPSDQGADGVVRKTLDTFAVNQEYDLHIFDGMSQARAAIKRRRWEHDAPLFCGSGYIDRDQCIPESCFAPSTFLLQDYVETGLRGVGAIWMLKDPRGEPCPACGDVAVSSGEYGGLHARVVAPDIIGLSRCVHLLRGLERAFREKIWRLIASHLRADSFDIRELERDFLGILRGAKPSDDRRAVLRLTDPSDNPLLDLSTDQRDWVADIISDKRLDLKSSSLGNLYMDWPAILLSGDRSAWPDALEKGKGYLPNLRDVALDSQYALGLFGIRIPALVLNWNPSTGDANKCSILPPTVSVRIDAYGRVAPQPSACRLFVPEEHGSGLRTAVGSAIIQHAAQLHAAHPDDQDWERWFQAFLATCELIKEAVFQEASLVQDSLTPRCIVSGRKVDLTLRQLCDQFGASAPAIREDCGSTTGIITQNRWGTPRDPWFLQVFPRRKLQDGTEVVDLSSLCEKLRV